MSQIKMVALIALWSTGFSQYAFAQSGYIISDSQLNIMTLSGTSSLHDWDMNAKTFKGDAHFDLKKGDDRTIVGLTSLSFSLPVTNLKSDKKGLDKNAYKALRSDVNKNILYKLLSANVSTEKNDNFLMKTTGNLTISGITKKVFMDVYCMVNEDATITCSGSEAFKMSDYQVKPPSFMGGVMKTGDAIKLAFTFVYRNVGAGGL